MKVFLIALCVVFCNGCATQEVHHSPQSKIPPGSEVLLEKSYKLIEAYQNNDNKKWSELRCIASEHDKSSGLSTVKFYFGDFSSPRLISISSTSDAGNSGNEFKWAQVIIEVDATNYSVGKLLLKFSENKENGCVSLII